MMSALLITASHVEKSCVQREYAYHIFFGLKKKSVATKNFGIGNRDGFKFGKNSVPVEICETKSVVSEKFLEIR